MKQSELNHLRRLLGWIGTKIQHEGPTAKPSGAAETYASRLRSAMTHRKIGISTLAAATGMHYQGVKQAIEGKSKSLSAANNVKAARFLEISPHWLATGQGAMLVPDATVPAYVVDAVKALEKALANGGPHRGVDATCVTAETRAVVDVAPGAAGGPAQPLSDFAMEQGLAEIGITAWGPRAEDWTAGAEYVVRLMRECLPKAAAETLPDRPGAAGNPAACRDTPAAPPTLRRDEGGGVGAARWSAPALRTQVERKTAGQVAEQEIDAIMEQAQVFASAWSFLGGPFDNGSGLETAERERAALRTMLSKLRAEGVQAGAATADIALPDVLPELTTPGGAQYVSMATMQAVLRAARAMLHAPIAGEEQKPVAEVVSRYGDPEAFGERDLKVLVDLNSYPYGAKFYAAPQASEAVRNQALAALESAQRFIRNGVEFGYIRMPDADTPDPAHRTPGLIDAAIHALKTLADKDSGDCANGARDATGRTPIDYAVEHAEYLAVAAEHLIFSMHRVDECTDMHDEDDSVLTEHDLEVARERCTEATNSLRSRIHEFRKRRDRAAVASQKSEGDAC